MSWSRGIATGVSVVVVAASACGVGAGEDDTDGRIPVVASTDVWGSVVAAIGGGAVSVTSFIDDAVGDPHGYETTPADAVAVSKAQLVIYNGGGYDDFAAELAETSAEAPVIDAFEVSGKGEEEAEHADEESDAHGHGHGHGGVNEHVWYDFDTVADVADQVATRLGEIRPESADDFAARAKEFTAELDRLGDELAALDGAEVIATEPVAHYLLEAAGIHDETPQDYSDAIENETDAPVIVQNEVNKLVEGKKVDAVINNPQTETPMTRQLVKRAERAGVPVVDITENLPEGVTGYISWVDGEVKALKAALGT